jgi:RimJ/RimL family protein N-acetyltransferase
MDLVVAADAHFLALIKGDAPEGFSVPDGGLENSQVLQMLRDLANKIRPTFQPAAWMIVEGREIVGLCSLVKEPSGEGIDIGYGIAPGRRRLGHASAAVAAILDWARSDNRVRSLRAETSSTNIPSQRVLVSNAFKQIGTRFDEEDGELICWSIRTAKKDWA